MNSRKGRSSSQRKKWKGNQTCSDLMLFLRAVHYPLFPGRVFYEFLLVFSLPRSRKASLVFSSLPFAPHPLPPPSHFFARTGNQQTQCFVWTKTHRADAMDTGQCSSGQCFLPKVDQGAKERQEEQVQGGCCPIRIRWMQSRGQRRDHQTDPFLTRLSTRTQPISNT